MIESADYRVFFNNAAILTAIRQKKPAERDVSAGFFCLIGLILFHENFGSFTVNIDDIQS